MEYEILNGKRLLAVDDEPDVLEIISDAFESSEVVTATGFTDAHALITKERFDLVILDIMGVNGFALLEICRENKLPTAMLTAHAVNVKSLNLAIRRGAISFLPKEELYRLPELVAEIFQCLEEGKSHWKKLFERLGPFFKKKLGVLWEDLDKSQFPPTYY
jgi:DNA-binding NtrC family response regulator